MSTRNFFATDITSPEGLDGADDPNFFEEFWKGEHEHFGWLGSVGCVERCPTTGRMHAHITWRERTSTRIKSRQGRYSNPNVRGIGHGVERRKGSWEDALDYILRRGPHKDKEGDLLCTWQLGTGPEQGKRTDQSTVAEMLVDGASVSTVLSEVAGSHRYVHAIQKTAAFVQASHRDVDIVVTPYKEEELDELFEEYQDNLLYVEDKFTCYDGQEVVYYVCEYKDIAKLRRKFKYEQYVNTTAGVMPARWVRVYLAFPMGHDM